MRAAKKGDTEALTLLLSHGADVEAKNIYEDTVLQLTAAKGLVAIVQ